MTFSVVIPTKNRPVELKTLFNSIINQNRMPDQVIVIDQSEIKNVIKKNILLQAKKHNIDITYIHDSKITGLVQAKIASIPFNRCDYISFFDDDVVLDKDYFYFVEKTFLQNKEMVGVNGLIVNLSKQNFFKRLLFKLTHFGLFSDDRQSTIRFLKSNDLKFKRVNTLSGGISTWKKEVFEVVFFDNNNLFHAYEDKEFSIRVEKIFPNSMFILSDAKLFHYHSKGNRQTVLNRTQKDIFEILVLFKKNGSFKYLGLDLIMILLGLFTKSIFISIKYRDIDYFLSFFKGFYNGYKKNI